MLFTMFDGILVCILGIATMLAILIVVGCNIYEKLKLLHAAQEENRNLFCLYYGIIKTENGYEWKNKDDLEMEEMTRKLDGYYQQFFPAFYKKDGDK